MHNGNLSIINFTVIGDAGIKNWSAYSHGETLVVEEQTTAFVALGYNIVYETWRTHYFDSVTISGLPLLWKKVIPRFIP